MYFDLFFCMKMIAFLGQMLVLDCRLIKLASTITSSASFFLRDLVTNSYIIQCKALPEKHLVS